mmetsp:Transcript_5929/g.20182  ORF Transcript_5929/g.20182 Transcript_5929/m.20182 type:complete len:272 (-) Transcript_5929:488-1303(-)
MWLTATWSTFLQAEAISASDLPASRGPKLATQVFWESILFSTKQATTEEMAATTSSEPLMLAAMMAGRASLSRLASAASAAFLMRSSCMRASPHLARASGSETSSEAASRAGRSLGRKGAARAGSRTSLDMLAQMTAHWRFTMVVRSLNPRRRRGTVMDRAGGVTVDTNTTPARPLMVSAVSLGLAMAEMSAGRRCSISRLPMDLQHSVMTALAPALTSALMSVMRGVTTGTMSARAMAHCSGAFFTRSRVTSRAVTRVWGFSLVPFMAVR